MPIGTAQGGYFETEFDHHAGINTDPSEDNATAQDVETKPADNSTDQTPDMSRVMRQPSNRGLDISRADMFRQMSDEQLLSHVDAMNDHVMHGSLEDINENLPHEEMARRQGTFDENGNFPEIGRRAANRDPLEQVPFTAVDHMDDEQFHQYGLHQEPDHMTPEQEARWARVDRQMSASDAMEVLNTTRNMSREERMASMRQEFAEQDRRQALRDKAAIDAAPRVVGRAGNITMKVLYDAGEGYGGGAAHAFGFMDKEGNYGHLSLTEKNDGKLLYVDWIGNVDQTLGEKVVDGKKIYAAETQNDIAPSEIRNLIKILKEKFPKAEEIEGFRISGARTAAGRGSGRARMRIRPKSDMPSESSIDSADLLLS